MLSEYFKTSPQKAAPSAGLFPPHSGFDAGVTRSEAEP
ncbi:hypothetical protein KNP414_05284 [Paenibacillus mucilaginosus KNP414]|uniref:Uncharacterized protein n=1 Tax=Paenibacillus mucilaginosus (strain KNP414) TaxID=1036673 RepID=F8FE49_PAEMK|nr:hypothetical protein KNP414_05284 [Paenibacillus mucilaginosus KNP414]